MRKYYQTLATIGFACGTATQFVHTAAAADWSILTDCARQNAAVVEQVEPSLFDGSRLIVDVLCQNEAVDLGNKLVSENPNAVKDHGGFGGAFGSYLSVMRRDVTKILFNQRRKRLGL
jgi:hypothetical protein